jgi:hypothetical protein
MLGAAVWLSGRHFPSIHKALGLTTVQKKQKQNKTKQNNICWPGTGATTVDGSLMDESPLATSASSH